MRRLATLLLKVFLFLAAFVAALWAFLPWREAGVASLTLAGDALERHGMRLAFSDVEAAEGGFTVNGLSVSGFTTFSFRSLTLRPQLMASLLSLAPVCEADFTGGEMTMGQAMNFGDGGFLLTAGRDGVLLERLRADGDFAVSGFVAVDPARMKISRAEAAISVPQSFEGNMETLQGFLPLVREGGGWVLRRTPSEGGAGQ